VAYRDSHLDVRTGLVAIVASHVPLVEERRSACREHDEVAEQVAELHHRLAELEREIARGGVASVVKQWLGASRPADLAPAAAELRRKLVDRTGRLAELASRERTIAAQLEEIAVARQQLAKLQQSRGRALRGSGSPLGNELRRIDEELAATDARVTALERALVAADRFGRVVGDIRALVEASLRGSSLAALAARAHAALTGDRAWPSERDRARTQLHEHVAFARDELRGFIRAFEALKLALDTPTRLAVVQLRALVGGRIAEPPEQSELVAGIEAAAASTARLVGVMDGELAGSHRRREAVVAQQRALEGRSG
jgi:hypothetical protein